MNPLSGPNPMRLQLSRRRGFILQWQSRALNGLPAINVARPGRYGNPHRIGLCSVCGVTHTRTEAIAELRAQIEADPTLRDRIRNELAGKNLACWCGPHQECHADILLAVANESKAVTIQTVVDIVGAGIAEKSAVVNALKDDHDVKKSPAYRLITEAIAAGVLRTSGPASKQTLNLTGKLQPKHRVEDAGHD